MKKKQSPRRFETGRSLYRYHGEWFEEKVIEAIVTDTHIGVDIDSQGEDGNKETLTIKADSVNNGGNFSGAYTPARSTYLPGKVEFKKYQSSQGFMFSGFWIGDGERDAWILELEVPEE